MTRVWAVWSDAYEQGTVEALFTTEELADEYVTRREAAGYTGEPCYVIRSYELMNDLPEDGEQ